MSSRQRTPRRLALRLLTVVSAVALLLTTFLVDAAYAHGSAIDPMSRNYGCWKRWGNDFQNPTMATQDPMCWQAWQADANAMWNWNGLYREGVAGNHQGAIPDGQLCSGGRTGGNRYAALDTIGNWQATPINNNFTLTVHDQARHGAVYYRVYVTRQGFNPLTEQLDWADLELLRDTGPIAPGAGSTTTDPVLNGVSVAINVNAPGRTGRHIVYTIWQAAHSDQSYYFCSDVTFPGGPSNPTTGSPTTGSPTSATPTSGPPTSSVPTSAVPSAPGGPGGSGCTATYTLGGQWPGGFLADIKVTAGAVTISSWTVTLTYANGQTVSSAWSAAITTSGATVTARSVNYNASLTSGASTTFGFLGVWNGTNSAPTLTCTAT